MREARPYTYHSTVQGMCRRCRSLGPARIIEEGGAVYQERLCPSCGPTRARIADSIEWYTRVMAATVKCRAVRGPKSAVREGCPNDCGPCEFHANACHLPVFSVTNQCNLACPICFTYNRNDAPYSMSRDELKQLLDRVVARSAPLDLINVTGGEPTLHPDILSLLEECKRPEIGRVTMNSNGLRLANDDSLAAEIARLGVYVILSLHTLDAERSRVIHGRDVTAAKMRALDALNRHRVGTTLLYVMIRGLNDDEAGAMLALARGTANVRSLTVQTMAYTGQGGGRFGAGEHMPLDGAAAAFEKAADGDVRREHFVPHPNAHPLCYSVAYYLKCGTRLVSFTDLFPADDLRAMLAGGYLLRPDGAFEEGFRAALDRLWANGADEKTLKSLKALIARLYPERGALSSFERQHAAEESILTIYLHSHMDEDTLDTSRLVVCPDQVPDSKGSIIPACAYNLFYRMRDQRFYAPRGTER